MGANPPKTPNPCSSTGITIMLKCPVCGREFKFENPRDPLYAELLLYRELLDHMRREHPNEKDVYRRIEKEYNESNELFADEVQYLMGLR